MKTDRKSSVRKWIIFSAIMFFVFSAIAGVLPAPLGISAGAAEAGDKFPGSFSQLAKDVSPSVVNVSTVKTVRSKGRGMVPFGGPFGQNDPVKDFFERFFGDQLPKQFRQQSLGTGFIIDKEGYILTNNHVVDQTDEIKVKLADEKEYTAKMVGRDPKTDLALIKIDPEKPLPALVLGDSDKLEVGDWVVAIGNPFGLGNTVTAGIVSAKYRKIGASSYDNFIQTDASINPGNSGGPLLNMAGEVVGINTAIFSQSGGSIGIGFAIPVNMAKDLIPQLKEGKVVRGWLGVMIQKITPELKDKLKLKEDKGALVADVTSGGPAEKAGIKRGDVIVAFDGKEIQEMNELPFVVASTGVGKTVEVKAVRKGETKVFKVKVGELKEEAGEGEAAEAEPALGMTVEDLNADIASELGITDKQGVVITTVERGSVASEAGIRAGDIVLEVDQSKIEDKAQFLKKIRAYKPGDTILFLLKRQNGTIFLTVTLPKS